MFTKLYTLHIKSCVVFIILLMSLYLLVNNIVTSGSNSRHMNFQRHKADDPAKSECEFIVTPVWCVSVCLCVCVPFVLVVLV